MQTGSFYDRSGSDNFFRAVFFPAVGLDSVFLSIFVPWAEKPRSIQRRSHSVVFLTTLGHSTAISYEVFNVSREKVRANTTIIDHSPHLPRSNFTCEQTGLA